jgi:hypothetical protein
MAKDGNVAGLAINGLNEKLGEDQILGIIGSSNDVILIAESAGDTDGEPTLFSIN